jgi:predicted RNase H-like HicB family nuclease
VIVSYEAESDTYLADVPALGFMIYGEIVEEAFAMAEDAIAGRLEAMEARGLPIPVEDRPIEVRSVGV